jgi:serine/threonine protein kinase/Flp pilus assembly protein TadD/TolB-like protein
MLGRTISHFEILEKLGEGGMGIVYCARDLKLDRLVALKILLPEQMGNPRRRARFAGEAKAASALNHPNIVTIYEIESVDGVDYIAMEYIRGQTLHELVRPPGMELSLALDYAAQIASGLAAAHSAGIIHRDVKPANIMVSKSGLVKLLDFGIALIEQPEVDPDSPTTTMAFLTRPGTVVGTLAYMSPEHAQGGGVSPRSDIFSLGVVIYQMLTGTLPFQAGSQVALLYEIVHTPAPALSRVRPELPPVLGRVLEKALEKDPEQRYQRAGELLNDLKEISRQLDTGVSASKISVALGARKVDRRKTLGIVALTASLLLLMAVVAWRFVPRWLNRVPAEKKIAVLPFRNIGGDRDNAAFCDGVMETLTSELTELSQFHGSLWVVPASEVRREGLASPGEARRALGANLVITGSVQRDHDQVVLTANLVDANTMRQLRSREIQRTAGDEAGLQDSVVQEIAGMLELELGTRERQALAAGQTGTSSAYDFYLQARGHLQRRGRGDIDQAIEMFHRAVEMDSKYALAYAGLGEAYWRKYRETRDTQWVDPARKNCQLALALNSQIAPVYLTLGIIEEGAGHHDLALDALEKARQLEPSNPTVFSELGQVQEAMGKFDQAEASFQAAAQLRPGDWTSLNSLGGFYYGRGRYQDAIPLFRKITELAPDNSEGYTNLGATNAMAGQYEAAAASFKQSLALRPTASAYTNLGTIDFFLGRCAEAVPLMEQASRLTPKSEQMWGNLGDAYACIPGRRADANLAYRRAVQLGQQRLAVNANDGETLSVVALYQAKLGDKIKALANIQKARHLAPASRKVLWEAALIYELAGNRTQALAALRGAIHGGQPLDEVRGEPALANLRADPRYQSLMAGLAAK